MSQGLCPSCGAAVNLTAGQDEINCTYCGTLVKRPEAEAQFAEVKSSKYAGTLIIADTSREGGSYEEAVFYYNKIIEQEPTFADAWLNKGICMLQTSKIGDLKTTEAISSWKAAIKFAKKPILMKKRVAKEIEGTVVAFYSVLESHYKEFSTLANSYAEHVSRFLKLENALALALELDSSNPDVCTAGINMCDAVLLAATDAGTSNAAVALLNKDWKGALTSAVGGFSAASAIRKPVEELKVKYQRALAKIDPNYKAPDLPPPMPSVSTDPNIWREALVAPLRKLGPPYDILLYPASSKQKDLEREMDEYVAFLSPTEIRADVLLFERNIIRESVLVTTKIIGWGTKGQTKKGFFSPAVEEKKVVILPQNLLDVVYARAGLFDAKEERPVVHYRNAFGVKETAVMPTSFFTMYLGLGLFEGCKHERVEAIILFLKNWASGR